MEKKFRLFLDSGNNSGKISSYVNAIKFVSRELLKEKKEILGNFDSILDIGPDSIETFYIIHLFVEKQKIIEDNIFNNKKPKSYWDKGFCSAGLKEYDKFLKKELELSEKKITGDNLASDLLQIIGDCNDKSKRIEIEARIGHGKYREDLIKLWGKCSVSEYDKVDLLIASHIKPWKFSNNQEKTDPYNGFLLIPNIDKLFDRGYISFDENGKVILSEMLSIREYEELGISVSSKLSNVMEENKKYLEFHRENIFLGK